MDSLVYFNYSGGIKNQQHQKPLQQKLVTHQTLQHHHQKHTPNTEWKPNQFTMNSKSYPIIYFHKLNP